jgi:hypothetical protein
MEFQNIMYSITQDSKVDVHTLGDLSKTFPNNGDDIINHFFENIQQTQEPKEDGLGWHHRSNTVPMYSNPTTTAPRMQSMPLPNTLPWQNHLEFNQSDVNSLPHIQLKMEPTNAQPQMSQFKSDSSINSSASTKVDTKDLLAANMEYALNAYSRPSQDFLAPNNKRSRTVSEVPYRTAFGNHMSCGRSQQGSVTSGFGRLELNFDSASLPVGANYPTFQIDDGSVHQDTFSVHSGIGNQMQPQETFSVHSGRGSQLGYIQTQPQQFDNSSFQGLRSSNSMRSFVSPLPSASLEAFSFNFDSNSVISSNFEDIVGDRRSSFLSVQTDDLQVPMALGEPKSPLKSVKRKAKAANLGEQVLSSIEENDEAQPRKQVLKFTNDQYTPTWVRFSGAKKEGLCDLCTPGKWLQLKNSAFW